VFRIAHRVYALVGSVLRIALGERKGVASKEPECVASEDRISPSFYSRFSRGLPLLLVLFFLSPIKLGALYMAGLYPHPPSDVHSPAGSRRAEPSMKARTAVVAVFAAAVGITVVACGAKKPPPKEPPHTETVADAGPDVVAEAAAPKPQSLFERLGKHEGITQFVDTFMKNLAADTKFNKRLTTVKGAKLEKTKKDLVDLICVESGGPEAGADCKYEGRFMKEVLGPKAKLKEEEWTSMLLDLRTALEEHKIGDTEQQDLASALGKFRDDVVEAPKAKR
jgi:truncated hemoglobin YjbI